MRDFILTGHYPTTYEEARDLAAIQLQIEEGNHNPAKHKPGTLEYNFLNIFFTLLFIHSHNKSRHSLFLTDELTPLCGFVNLVLLITFLFPGIKKEDEWKKTFMLNTKNLRLCLK